MTYLRTTSAGRTAMALLLVCGAGGSCTRSPSKPETPQAGPDVLALVNGQAISVQDLAGRINELSEHARRAYAGSPERLQEEAERLVEDALIVSVARKRGYDRDPRIQRLLREQLIQMVREDIRQLVNINEITDDEIRSYYERHPDAFTTPLRLRASHILLADEPAAQKLLQRLRSEGGTERAFARAAQRVSLDLLTRDKGGDLGVATQPGGPVTPAIFRAMHELNRPGELGGPVRSPQGWHVLRLTERHEPERHPLEQVTLAAKMGAFREKRNGMYAKFLQETHAAGQVLRFYNRMDKVQALLEQPAALLEQPAGKPTQSPQ